MQATVEVLNKGAGDFIGREKRRLWFTGDSNPVGLQSYRSTDVVSRGHIPAMLSDVDVTLPKVPSRKGRQQTGATYSRRDKRNES